MTVAAKNFSKKPLLLLGSNSSSRKQLLTDAQIPFEVVGHTADESEVDVSLALNERVIAIARHKMNHVKLPDGKEGGTIFVLTADTMGCDVRGVVTGKPLDRDDAVKKIKNLTVPHTTATAFVLAKKRFEDGQWHDEQVVEKIVSATYEFVIPEHWVERYLVNSWGLNASGAIAIEHYGEQFLKNIEGSYTAVKGLPMFELREALESIGFF